MAGSLISLVAVATGGICWTVTYLDCIRIGLKHKTHAMPLWALALNFGWEALYTVLGFLIEERTPRVNAQCLINLLWTLFDVGIVYTYFKYGGRYWSNKDKEHFVPWSIFAFILSFGLQGMFVLEFGLAPATRYSAFLSNLLMSVLFVEMFFQRGSAEGQTLVIAVLQMARVCQFHSATWLGR